MNYAHLWRGTLLILSLVAIGYFARQLQITEMMDSAWMDAHIRGQGIRGELLFLSIGAGLTAVGMPRQVLSFLGGYSFGLGLGLLLSLLATVLGAALDFWYARLLGRALIQKLFPNKIRHLDHFTRDAPFQKSVAIRLLPVGNNMLTCLLAGVSGIGAAPFLLGSAVGYVPQTLIFALAGTGTRVDPVWHITIAVVLFLLFGIMAIRWYRHLRPDQADDIAELGTKGDSIPGRDGDRLSS